MVVQAGYAGGFAEVEILSKRWWAEDPEVLLPLLRQRHETAV
jgi:hypothetical protein